MNPGADALVVHLRAVGVVMACLVGVNLVVPRRFNWREEMSRLSLLNRQIVQAHITFIILLLAMLSALLLAAPHALLEPTRLGRSVLSGLTVFWGLRMLMQWFFYAPGTWRGDRFNTVVHYVFSLIWIYVTAVFVAALWSTRSV